MRNIAAFPLAIPLMAGPGAITATVARRARSRQLAADRRSAGHDRRSECLLRRRVFFRWPYQRASRHDWKYRAVTPSWRATRRIGRSICGRRRARDLK